MAKFKKISQRQIREMANTIVRQFDPERIILFGSYATGLAGPDSDVDLLVVMPVVGSKRKKAVEIGVALHDMNVAKDVIVVRPEEFEWRKDIAGTIEWPAARQGKVLYAQK
ncbi:MAG: nucleotidyltransferase domain-containing protein [Sedimentisphaerales bacterium]|nr:nucleotidyltransferase domain-containing protein [Sedimentisphaerales bacterium]